MYTKLANRKNYSVETRPKSSIKFIVLHFTANNGDTARDNAEYFARVFVGASAHFFVDENEICCSVPWDKTAYHCGTAGKYKHSKCRNYNSLGIEMCSRKDISGKYYFKTETIVNSAKFTAQQMKNYNIPIENVIRHYDVTGKKCPAPFVDDAAAWENFKKLVLKYYNGETEKEDIEVVYYEKLEEIPKGEKRDVISRLIDRGVIKGNDKGLHLSDDMIRILIFNDRMGLYK